jgi:hypothetical protein
MKLVEMIWQQKTWMESSQEMILFAEMTSLETILVDRMFVKVEEFMLIQICLLQLHCCGMSVSLSVLILAISKSDKWLLRGLRFALQLRLCLLPVQRRTFRHLCL